jgi:hypothetical protein
MAVWTISAQEGTGGERLATSLAAAAGVPLLDRQALALAIPESAAPLLADVDDLEERVCGRFALVSLSLALRAGSEDAWRELQLRKLLPELGRTVTEEAARQPCVIFAPAAFAALSEHPSAVHVRLRAPLDWRIAAYQREQVVDRRRAERAVGHDDHSKRAWVRSLYHVDIDDPCRYSVVLDASRLSTDRLVELLLAAGGARPTEPEPGAAAAGAALFAQEP